MAVPDLIKKGTIKIMPGKSLANFLALIAHLMQYMWALQLLQCHKWGPNVFLSSFLSKQMISLIIVDLSKQQSRSWPPEALVMLPNSMLLWHDLSFPQVALSDHVAGLCECICLYMPALQITKLTSFAQTRGIYLLIALLCRLSLSCINLHLQLPGAIQLTW